MDAEHDRSKEIALHDSDESFRLLVEKVREYAIFMLDADGRIASWNEGARRIKGYEAGEILGRHFSTFYTREDVERGHPDEELRVAARDGSYEEEGWRLRKDGTRFWASVSITALRDDGGDLRGFAKVTRDVTERKLAEAKLRESEERFRLLVKGVKDYAIFMLDPDGNVATWNVGAERINGYGADEILGRHFSAFYPDEDAERGKPDLELEIAKAEGTYEEEGLRVRKDGSTFWASVSITALRDDGGDLRGFAKVTRDVTERRRAEQALREREERFRLLVQGSSDVVSIFDAVGTVLYQSPSLERVLGYKPEDRVGKNVFVDPLVHPEDISNKRAFFADARRNLDAIVRAEFRLKHADGSWRHIEAAGRNMLQEPSIAGIVANYHDVTERKEAERALREAQEAERRRIARDLHDSVLQDLAGAVRLAEVARLVPQEAQAGDELEALTEVIRDSMRGVREAVYELHPDGINEDGSFARSLEALVEASRRLSPELETEVELDDLPSRLPDGMGRELLRVVQEALTNVRRHSGARRVRVDLRATADRIEAEVSDDGRGFDASSISGGLGRVSMRERVAAFGGELTVESEPGRGTRVRFWVPLHL